MSGRIVRSKGKGPGKKRGQRATSNIFAMFDQAQIQEFKEVSVQFLKDRISEYSTYLHM